MIHYFIEIVKRGKFEKKKNLNLEYTFFSGYTCNAEMRNGDFLSAVVYLEPYQMLTKLN